MSLESEPLPPVDQPSRIDDSRRKRRRKLLIPQGRTERSLYVGEIARRLVPGVEFFIFSLTSGLIIAAAILLDSPAIFILGALLAPFMVPVVGLGFSAAVGSLGFFIRSIFTLLIGSALVFASGALGGWLSRSFVQLPRTQAERFTAFSAPDFLLLTIGVVMAVYLTIRIPKQRSQLASFPLAYEIYIPVAVAGFGLTSGQIGFFPEALKIAAVYIAWVILVGTLVLAILKLRPFTFFGYLLTAIIIGAAVYTLVISSALGTALEKQAVLFATSTQTPTDAPFVITSTPAPGDALASFSSPTVSATETPFPTNTLVPTKTPTTTITPKPTPVWAKVFSSTMDGVWVREGPGFDTKVLTSLNNEEPVQVLPETEFVDGYYWSHILLEDGQDGWVLRSLLITATPPPG